MNIFQRPGCDKSLSTRLQWLRVWREPRHAGAIRVLVFILNLALINPLFGWAFAPDTYAPASAAAAFKPGGFDIPRELAQATHVSDRRLPVRIIHIQDLHCHYPIQKNIAELLSHLARTRAVSLVLIEGAHLPVNVTKLSSFPDPHVRQLAAELLLRSGRLSGAEYFAAQHPGQVILEGMEEDGEYRASHELALRFLTDESEGLLCDLRQALESLKPRLYSLPLLKLDDLKTATQNGQISLKQYCRQLLGFAQGSLDLAGYPNLLCYTRSSQAEFPPEVEAENLYREMQVIDLVLRRELYTQPLQAELDGMLHRLDLLEGLLNIALTPEELNEVRAHPEQLAIGRFLDFLQPLASGLQLEPTGDLPALDAKRLEALEFYRKADQRSRTFVRRALEALERHRSPLAVIISGGYHTALICEALEDAGAGYISVRPRMSEAVVYNPYLSLLRRRQTPWERLVARNQMQLALPPFFAQHAEPEAILQENDLPEETRQAYQMLEMVLKLGSVQRLWAKTGSVRKMAAALDAELRRYAADSGLIRFDMKQARTIGQTLVLPLAGRQFIAVLQPLRRAVKLPQALAEPLVLDDFEVSFHPLDQRRTVEARLQETQPGLFGRVALPVPLLQGFIPVGMGAVPSFALLAGMIPFVNFNRLPLLPLWQGAAKRADLVRSKARDISLHAYFISLGALDGLASRLRRGPAPAAEAAANHPAWRRWLRRGVRIVLRVLPVLLAGSLGSLALQGIAHAAEGLYYVGKGDTLWALAKHLYPNLPAPEGVAKLAAANQLADPNKIRYHSFNPAGEPSAYGTTLKVDFDPQQTGTTPIHGQLVEIAPEPIAQTAAEPVAPQTPDPSILAPTVDPGAAAAAQPGAMTEGWQTWFSDPALQPAAGIGIWVLLAAVAAWLAWSWWRQRGTETGKRFRLAERMGQAWTRWQAQVHDRQIRLYLWGSTVAGKAAAAASGNWSTLTSRVSPLRGAVFLVAAGAVIAVGVLQPALPLSLGISPLVSWGTSAGLAGLLLIASYLNGRPAPIRAGPAPEEPSLKFLRDQIAKRRQSRFTLWPIYGELLGDIKLAVGLVPILLHLSPAPPTWAWTLGALAGVLLALGLFTFVSNYATALLRQRRLLSWYEVVGGLREEWKAQKSALVKNLKEYRLTKQQTPLAAMLAVALMILARLLDYSTVLGYTVNFNAVMLFALAGGFLVIIGLRLLKLKNKTEWLDGVVSKALRIVCAVVLIEVCKFPTSFFFVLFFGSSVLASNSTTISLRMLKKVVGVLSFAQFFLHLLEWLHRIKRKELQLNKRPARTQGPKPFRQRVRDSFGRGQPLRQILFVFMLSSMLLLSFYLSLPLPVMLAGQTVLLAFMLGQWLQMAKNPKISQQVKVIILASLLPAALVVFSMSLAFALSSVHAIWPGLLPAFVSTRVIELQAALSFLRSHLQELVIFVSFMYSLLGFSSVLKDQDKVSQVSEAAPDRLHVLQETLNRYIKNLDHYLKPDEVVDWERLRKVCQASRVILVPKKSQPTWMSSLLEGGVFSLDQEIYFRRRMFNLLSNRTVAAMIFREALIQAGLPLERVQHLVAEVTAADPQTLALIGKRILEAGNRREADVALEFELHSAAQDPGKRAEYLRQVLERRYGVRFPIRPGTYVREFNGRWDQVNEKVVVLLKYGLIPHPFLFRTSRAKLETAAKYIYQRVKMGELETVKLYREALNLTRQVPAETGLMPATEEEEVEDIIESYHAGQAGPRIVQPRTRWQRVWFPVRPLFFRPPATPLEAWQPRQPWAGMAWLWEVTFMLLTLPWQGRSGVEKTRLQTDNSPRAKVRILRRYGLEAHPLIMRHPAERIEQAAVYIQLRREGGAPLSLRLYREALLATRPAGWPLAAGLAEQQAPVESAAQRPPANTREAQAEAQALQAWQAHAAQDDPGANQPVAPSRSRLARAWRWFMLATLFDRLPEAQAPARLKQPWQLAGFFFQLPLRLWRGAVWLWIASRPVPRFDGEELPERRPEVADLLRQYQLPDPMALRLFARHTGLRLQSIQVRALESEGRRLPAFFGRYREQGENGRPTLYVPAALLRSLLNGMPADDDSLNRRWRRLAFMAKRFLLGLILEYHAHDYYQQDREWPRLEPGDWTWAQAGVPRTRLLVDLHAGEPASLAWRAAGKRVCLSVFDLLRLVDQLESESRVLLAGPTSAGQGSDAWVEALARQVEAGAEPNFTTLAGVLGNADEPWDVRTALVATAIREADQLPQTEQGWVRRDLMAALIQAQAPAVRAQVTRTEEEFVREVYVYAMPETIRRLRMQSQARLQALSALRATRPVRALCKRWQEIERALAGAETAAPGSLARLDAALGQSLWLQSGFLMQDEAVHTLPLASDLGRICLGVATGRLEWHEKSGVLLPVRQVLEVSSARQVAAEDLAIGRVPEETQSRPYQGGKPERVGAPAGGRWLFSAAVFRLSRRWPKSWQWALDQMWLARSPEAYLAAVLRGDHSPLAALLQKPDSPLGQAYLRFTLQQNEIQLQTLVRSLVRVVTNLKQPREQEEALRTFSRLVEQMPLLRGTPIGKWEPEIAESTGLALLVPELLLKPGQSGLLGALLDRVRALPIQLDLNPLEPLRRRYFRLAGQAA
ncbi:MAG: LysM domain-containing protein [candidate division FCPU426 bacterium]